MNLYFAPLEGITGYTYRNVHNEFFGGCDSYFAPFIVPGDNERVTKKSLRDILPENNEVTSLKVQVLTNKSDAFLKFEGIVSELGYDEVNLNLGCPSGTVVTKGRGAGFLKDLDGMDRFFYEIFEKTKLKITVKTRIGFYDDQEIYDILDVYNKYPIEEIIVHPRVREDFYRGEVNLGAFDFIYSNCKIPICYNGDICTLEDYRKTTEKYPGLKGVMIGRGAVCNPGLFREIKGGGILEAPEAVSLTKKLADKYSDILGSETFTLHKLKEVWSYMILNYPENKKMAKTIKKAKKIDEFIKAIEDL